MEPVTIRPGKPEDAQKFAKLIMLTARPYLKGLFGKNAEKILMELYRHPYNFFSHQYTHFIEVNGRIAGMNLSYSYASKQRSQGHFIMLLIRLLKWRFIARLGRFIAADRALARIGKGDTYSSNTAVFPVYRKRGLATKLIKAMEAKAGKEGSRRVVLEVAHDNHAALKIREKLGYKVVQKCPVFGFDNHRFEYLKMAKNLA